MTVRHSIPGNPERLRIASRHDGWVNSEAERQKLARYPEGVTPWRATPLALETFGRHGRLALEHLARLARGEAAKVGAGGDDEEGDGWFVRNLKSRWGARISVALHRANARSVFCALGLRRDARTQWLESDLFDH